MNNNDIQLITSLIGGELSEADEQAAFARIGSDPELQAAYEEQLAVTSLLQEAPKPSMTAAESVELRTALRAELHLDDVVAAAPVPSRARWWAPLTGLTVAAVVVFAIAVVPNLLDGTDSADLVSAPALQNTETTTASELAPAAEDGAEAEGYLGLTGETFEPTTPAAGEAADSEFTSYFVAPSTAGKSQIELPVAELESLNQASLDPALARSRQFANVDVDTLSGCFGGEAPAISLEPVAATPDGTSVYAIATDEASGDQTVVLVNLLTCEVTTAG